MFPFNAGDYVELASLGVVAQIAGPAETPLMLRAKVVSTSDPRYPLGAVKRFLIQDLTLVSRFDGHCEDD